jgi:hypothetical protein
VRTEVERYQLLVVAGGKGGKTLAIDMARAPRSGAGMARLSAAAGASRAGFGIGSSRPASLQLRAAVSGLSSALQRSKSVAAPVGTIPRVRAPRIAGGLRRLLAARGPRRRARGATTTLTASPDTRQFYPAAVNTRACGPHEGSGGVSRRRSSWSRMSQRRA